MEFIVEVPVRTNLKVGMVNGGALLVENVEGDIETSNVNIAATLVDMIEFQRQFEVAVRMMQTADQNATRAASLASIS